MIFENIDDFLDNNNDHLVSFTVSTYNNINLIRDLLNIKTGIKYSSDFSTEGLKDELLAELCEHVGATEYISPPGSKVYLNDSDSFIKRKIPVKYFNYKHVSYPQLHGGFIQYMSVIDLLFNYGSQSKKI